VSLALTTDETLLALKVGFLVLLYLFVWVVVRTATRNVTAAPQESIILSPADAAALRASVAPPTSRLVVGSSPALERGARLDVAGSLRIGRGAESDVPLDGDSTVSSRHAVVTRRADGLWVEDAGSTNGTFVNGARVTSPRLLQPGDVVRVGHTDLVVES
jgi:pSer/pThr/pTyr-binding forkhead associated (FHA) protein